MDVGATSGNTSFIMTHPSGIQRCSSIMKIYFLFLIADEGNIQFWKAAQ